MVHSQATKVVNVIIPADYASTGTTTATLDTLGFNYAQLRTTVGNDTAVTDVLKLGEDETTVVSSMTDIAAFLGGTAFTIPGSSTAAKVVIFNIDLQIRKRYLHLTHHGTGTVGVNSEVTLSRAHTIPDTAAEQGGDIVVVG